MATNRAEKRAHRRIDVNETCRITIGKRTHSGRDGVKSQIVNISLGGAAIRFGMVMDKPPRVGTPVNIYISGIGDFPSKVMRVYEGGFAIAFRPLKSWDQHLVKKLELMLGKYTDGE